jgi:hypothetical protein
MRPSFALAGLLAASAMHGARAAIVVAPLAPTFTPARPELELSWPVGAVCLRRPQPANLSSAAIQSRRRCRLTARLSAAIRAQGLDAHVVLAADAPVFTFFKDADCGALRNCTEFLVGALAHVAERDLAGLPALGRNASDMLNITAAGWRFTAAPLADSLGTRVAEFVIPLKKTPPACAAPPANATRAVGPDAAVVLELLLPREDTNTTFGEETIELLGGNLKWNVKVKGWPFCSSANKLAVNFLLQGAANTTAPTTVNSTALLAQVEEQRALLLEGADIVAAPAPAPALAPALVPAPAPASAGILATLDAVLGLVASAGGRLPVAPAGVGNGRSAPGQGGCGAGNGRGPPFQRPADAIAGREYAAGVKAELSEKFEKGRPVAGFGRRGLETPGTFIFFPPGRTARQAKVDVPAVAMVDGAAALVAVAVKPPAPGQAATAVELLLPYFNSTMTYDPVAAVAASEAAVGELVQEALANPPPAVAAAAPAPAPAPVPPPSPSPAPAPTKPPVSGASATPLALAAVAALLLLA